MTNYPYILFNKSPEQLRLLGARGGRAYGRNQRDRRAPKRESGGPNCRAGNKSADRVLLSSHLYPMFSAEAADSSTGVSPLVAFQRVDNEFSTGFPSFSPRQQSLVTH